MPVTVTVSGSGLQCYEVATDSFGCFSIGLSEGVYDIGVKGLNTLSVVRVDVTIGPWPNIVDFGTLIAGDASGDDYVGGAEYSLLYTYYGQTVPPAPQGIDFNGDGYVGGADYSLLYANWGKVGEMVQ